MGWEFSCMEKVANLWKRAQVYEERAARSTRGTPGLSRSGRCLVCRRRCGRGPARSISLWTSVTSERLYAESQARAKVIACAPSHIRE